MSNAFIVNDRRPFGFPALRDALNEQGIGRTYAADTLPGASAALPKVSAVGLAGTMTPSDEATKKMAEKLDPTERAWVKIPGMDPHLPNALRPLTLEECDRLIERATLAKVKISKAREQKIREERQSLQPGDRVRGTKGSTGTVVTADGIYYVYVIWDRKQEVNPYFAGRQTRTLRSELTKI